MSDKLQILIEAILSKTTKQQLVNELKNIEAKLKPIEINANVDKVSQQFKVLADGTKELKKVTTEVTNQFGYQVKSISNVDKETKQLVKSTEIVTNNLKKQLDERIKISDIARKLSYEENQNRLKQVTETQNKIERFITQSNETIAQRNMRSEMLNIDPTQYEQLWKKLLYEQEKSIINDKEKTIEIQKQIALYKQQLAIKLENAKTTYGKHFTDEQKTAILNKSDLINVQNYKDALKDTNLEYDSQISKARTLRKEATLSMEKSDGFMKTLSKDFGKMVAWSIVGTALFGSLRQLQQGLETLKELDSLMVDIAKVTNLTTEEMIRLKDASFEVSSAFGRTAQDYLGSVAEFSRAGYDKMAEGLAKVSLLAQNVGELTTEQANQFLLATDAAYKYSGSQEKLTQVLDGVNEIDNKFATSIGKVSEGITVAGSIASNAGVDINELSAAIGTMTAVTQKSGNEMGRAFRGMLMNIRQIKGQTEDGEIIDDEALSKSAKALNDVGIKVHELRNGIEELRNPMEVIKELADKWETLSSMQQAPIIEALGGKYRGNAVTALLENFDMYEKMLKTFSESTGSAMAENEKRMNSWQAKLNQLSNAMGEFWNKSIDTNVVKNMIDTLTSLVGTMDNLGSVVLVVTGLLMTFNAKALVGVLTSIPSFVAGVISSAKNLFAFKTAMEGATLAASNFQRALGIIGIVLTAATFAYSAFNQQQEEARQKAKEITDKLQQEADALQSLKFQYSEIANSGNITADSKNKLKTIQDQLIKTYKLEADAIDLVNGKYEEQLDLINQAISKKSEEYLNTERTNYNNASKILSRKSSRGFGTGFSTGQTVESEISKAVIEANNLDKSYIIGAKLTLEEYYNLLSKTIEEQIKFQEAGSSKYIGDNSFSLLNKELNNTKKLLEDNKSVLDEYLENQNVVDFYNTFKSKISEVNSAMNDLSKNSADKEASEKLIKLKNEIISISNNNGKLNEFQGLIDDLFKTVKEDSPKLVDTLDNAFNFSSLETSVQTIQKIKEETKDLTDAISEYNDKGKFSNETLLEIVSKYPKFIQYLGNEKELYEAISNELNGKTEKVIEAYNNELTALETSINEKTRGYAKDIKNWYDAEKAKHDITKAMLKKVGEAYDEFLLRGLDDETAQIQASKIAKRLFDNLNSAMPDIGNYIDLKKFDIKKLLTPDDKSSSTKKDSINDILKDEQKYQNEIIKAENESKDLLNEEYEQRLKNLDLEKKANEEIIKYYESMRSTAKAKGLEQELNEKILKVQGDLQNIEKERKEINKDIAESIKKQAEEEKKLREEQKKQATELIDSYQQYVIDGIEKEIDKLEESKKKAKEVAQVKIDAINAEIAKLEDRNDEIREAEEREQKLLDLAKAREKLANIRKERNVQVYKEGQGFVWSVDPKAEQEAMENLQDIEKDYYQWESENARNRQVEALKAQIKSIEDQLKKDEEGYDKRIEAYKKFIKDQEDALKASGSEQITSLDQLLNKLSGLEEESYIERLGQLQTFLNERSKLIQQINALQVTPLTAQDAVQTSIVPTTTKTTTTVTSTTTTTPKKQIISGNNFAQYASGTDSSIEGLSLVGEKGAELKWLSKDSKILPSDLTKQLLELPFNLNKLINIQPNKLQNGQPSVVNHYSFPNMTVEANDGEQFIKSLRTIIRTS